MAHSPVVEFSPLDTERFSVRVARAAHVTESNFLEILKFCASTNIDLLIARCLTEDVGAAQRLESHNFSIMDTLIYSTFDLMRNEIPAQSSKVKVRRHTPEDKMRVTEIAAAAFKGYRSHYHADARLDRQKCDAAYISWAERSFADPGTDEILIAEHRGQAAGFATLRLNSAEEGEGVLFAVTPEAQGLGIFRSLLVSAVRWGQQKRVNRMIYSTQLTNTAVQRVLCRVGFEPSSSLYTFHKWFTGTGK